MDHRGQVALDNTPLLPRQQDWETESKCSCLIFGGAELHTLIGIIGLEFPSQLIFFLRCQFSPLFRYPGLGCPLVRWGISPRFFWFRSRLLLGGMGYLLRAPPGFTAGVLFLVYGSVVLLKRLTGSSGWEYNETTPAGRGNT